MRWRLLLVLLPALGCASARAPPTPEVGPPAAKLFPLAVGNRWTYRVQFMGADQILSLSIVSGELGAFVDSRGQRYFVDHAGVRDDRRYLLRDPVAPGRSWSSVVSLTETEHYQVAGVGESVDVPAGHFAGCVRVEGRNPGPGNSEQLAEQVYCPGVGLVRVTTYEEIGGRRGPPQWREELVAYRLGG
ncbi:MAG: hypothetical protein ACYDCL_18780 [Myxococcales bacterium]